MPRAVILDVPVMWQSAGGFTSHMPLAVGDTVMLLFNERDISGFKQTLESGPPLSDDIMEMQHAVALPCGFGPQTITPVDGAVLQTNDGSTYVSVEDGQVTVRASTVILTGSVTNNGVNVGSTLEPTPMVA